MMAEGTNVNNGKTPPTHNPVTKIETYKWAPKAIILNKPQTVTIPAARIYENAYFRINYNGTVAPPQYFIIEFKEKKGFDERIPGEGLLIYRATEPYSVTANTTSPQRFYPVCANAPVAVPEAGTNKQTQYGSINNANCPWPGSSGKTTFNDSSIPGMISWTSQPFGQPITNIERHGDYITFDFMGGGPKTDFHVFLPAYFGCFVSPVSSTSPVSAGGSFSFKIDLMPTFRFDKVTANDVELTPAGGVYTISNITADQIIRITGIISVNEFKDYSDNISVYPNPTTGKLTITYHELRITGINIFDIYGRKVAAKFPSNSLEGWQPQADGVVFNISHLASGIYMVQIQTDKGMITKKVVKE
jgi:hypothetical protein